jgi:hypothetical protein
MTNQISKCRQAFVSAFVFVMILAVPEGLFVAAQNQNEDERSREVATRFTDTMIVPTRTGTTIPFRVTLKEWRLAGHERDISIPQQGFYIAQLRWGAISTQIADKREIRHPGDFWAVQLGAHMIIRIKAPGEEALIQTFSVSTP